MYEKILQEAPPTSCMTRRLNGLWCLLSWRRSVIVSTRRKQHPAVKSVCKVLGDLFLQIVLSKTKTKMYSLEMYQRDITKTVAARILGDVCSR